jgi:hypothetical protein|tara:strand:- start:1029 stop:1277 length:249 start_codon:yes stop_codon:yes gene_type:complete
VLEIALSVLLAIASAIGVHFWRKSESIKSVVADEINQLRAEARAIAVDQEETVVSKVKEVKQRVDEVGDDRQALADLLNEES